ncbi:MAG TPA: cell division protein FtsQ/DivIB [Solirubrobacteraceae bacterium]
MAPFARRRVTRVALAIAVALAVLTPLALWLRDSSLIRVTHVTITGIDGRQAREIRSVLTAAGEDMTTLDVREDALLAAAAPYPIVRSLRTKTDFPHGLAITINAYEPVGALQPGAGRLTPVASDGTLLRGAGARDLPLLGVKTITGGDRVRDKTTMGAVNLLAAAPPALRARVARVFRGKRGWALSVNDGPKLYFGAAGRLKAKWEAAAQVLAHPSSRGARYVDVRIPERPVAGGLTPRRVESQPQL